MAGLTRIFGENCIITGQAAKLGAEDFADYVQTKPGTFIRFGTGGSESNSYPHHNGHFDIDESALKTIVAVHLTVALNTLNLRFLRTFSSGLKISGN